MSYNGSGTFNINTTGQPVVTGTVISSSAFNALTSDLATGLSTAICKDGQTTVTANIPMNTFKFTNLGAGTAATDSVRLGQLQAGGATVITVSGTDTYTGTMSPALSAYAAGNTFTFVVPNTNTTSCTLNIDGLGAKAITRDGSTALVAGDLVANSEVIVVYDGTRFQVLNSNSKTNFIVSNNLTAAALIPSGSTVPTNGIYLPSANTVGISSNTTNRVTVGLGVQIGAPTGGDKGAGTLNATALYINGTAVTSTTPGGSNTQIQYNNSGAFGGTTLTYNSATGAFTIATPTSGTALTITAVGGGASNGGIVLNGSGNTPSSAVTFSATAMTLDCTKSNVFTTTFTANVTTAPTISNPQDGQTINWFITQDATGSRTMTWPTSFKWPGGTAGVLSTAANSVDLLVATYRSSTGFWYASLSKAFS